MIFLTIPMMADALITAGSGPVLLSSMSVGVSIAIAGLTIVFLALLLISVFIASMPRLLVFVAQIWPEVEDRHSAKKFGGVSSEGSDGGDGASLAAIGFVLHTEFQRQRAADQASKGNG